MICLRKRLVSLHISKPFSEYQVYLIIEHIYTSFKKLPQLHFASLKMVIPKVQLSAIYPAFPSTNLPSLMIDTSSFEQQLVVYSWVVSFDGRLWFGANDYKNP